MRERIEIDNRQPHDHALANVRIVRLGNGRTKLTIDGIDLSSVVDDFEVRHVTPGVQSLSLHFPAVAAVLE